MYSICRQFNSLVVADLFWSALLCFYVLWYYSYNLVGVLLFSVNNLTLVGADRPDLVFGYPFYRLGRGDEDDDEGDDDVEGAWLPLL